MTRDELKKLIASILAREPNLRVEEIRVRLKMPPESTSKIRDTLLLMRSDGIVVSRTSSIQCCNTLGWFRRHKQKCAVWRLI